MTDERQGLLAEEVNPRDPVAAIDLVRWELSLMFGEGQH
jgi:hypothetical protein